MDAVVCFCLTFTRCNKVVKKSTFMHIHIHAQTEARSKIWSMNSCVCIFLSIHQANCGQPQTVLGCQLRHFSSRATSLSHLSLFAVFSDLSISPFIFLQSSPHSSTSQLFIAWFLCPLISLHAFILLSLCLPRHVSQSVSPRGTVKTWMHLNPAGMTFPPCVFFTQPRDIKQVKTPDLPLMINEDVSTMPWCKWKWY